MEENDKKDPLTIVEIIEGGPLKIKGQIILKDLKRDTLKYCDEVSLCRCGASTTKPFCDRSHNK
jgi:CDGSH-type Zn-finger protein